MSRQRLSNRRASAIQNFTFENHRYRATVSHFDDGAVAELFLDAGKSGAELQHHASTSAILASKLLQLGEPPEAIIRSVGGVIGAALAYFTKTPAVPA